MGQPSWRRSGLGFDRPHENLWLHAGYAGVRRIFLEEVPEEISRSFVEEEFADVLGGEVSRRFAMRCVSNTANLRLANDGQQGKAIEVGNHLGK